MKNQPCNSFYKAFKMSDCDLQKIDGGFLLHRVVWSSTDNFGDLYDKYYKYIIKHFSGQNISVIFDGIMAPISGN